MDLFDRRIISYAIGTSLNLGLTNASLRGALATLENGQKPLVHSDQGFQYQHNSWRTLLANAGAIQSMSRKANCYDNAVMENFFEHLKEELFHRVRFLNTDALASAPYDYIRWYNTERISTKLKGLSRYSTVLKCLRPRSQSTRTAGLRSPHQAAAESTLTCPHDDKHPGFSRRTLR
jgi:putative transposase